MRVPWNVEPDAYAFESGRRSPTVVPDSDATSTTSRSPAADVIRYRRPRAIEPPDPTVTLTSPAAAAATSPVSTASIEHNPVVAVSATPSSSFVERNTCTVGAGD